jgi:hypothetical protein
MSIWPQADDTQELLAEVRAGQSDAIDRLFDHCRTAVHRMESMHIDSQGRDTSLTRTGTVLGTPSHMAPGAGIRESARNWSCL